MQGKVDPTKVDEPNIWIILTEPLRRAAGKVGGMLGNLLEHGWQHVRGSFENATTTCPQRSTPSMLFQYITAKRCAVHTPYTCICVHACVRTLRTT